MGVLSRMSRLVVHKGAIYSKKSGNSRQRGKERDRENKELEERRGTGVGL